MGLELLGLVGSDLPSCLPFAIVSSAPMIGRMPARERGLVKARRAVDAVAIEQRQRGVAEIGRAIDERFGQRRALEKAEGGGGVELDVHGRITNSVRNWNS